VPVDEGEHRFDFVFSREDSGDKEHMFGAGVSISKIVFEVTPFPIIL